jgi:hypothetical protein
MAPGGTNAARKDGRGRPFWFRRLPAFTLAESLTVLVVLFVLLSASFVVRGVRGADPEKEARSLARWLSGVMTASNRSGRSFTLRCAGNVARKTVEAVWQRPAETKTYASLYGCVFKRYNSAVSDSVYSPQWNTLTPAATIKVQDADDEGKTHFVIVSQHGGVRTSTSPPR